MPVTGRRARLLARDRKPGRPPAPSWQPGSLRRPVAATLAFLTIATLATAIPLATIAFAGSGANWGLLPVIVLGLLFLAPAAWLLIRSAAAAGTQNWTTPLFALAALPFILVATAIQGLALAYIGGDQPGLVTVGARGAPLVLLAAAAGSFAVAVVGVVTAVRSRTRRG
ncbi:MAG: hypothetical protein NVS9B1_08890 [Candidatus Dormibacteraceae bacterium]